VVRIPTVPSSKMVYGSVGKTSILRSHISVSSGGMATSADLVGSSKYSSDTLED
jgi:hypothetical protein